MLYNIFCRPPYGHVIKLRVCGMRRSPPARDLRELPKFAEMLLEIGVAFITP